MNAPTRPAEDFVPVADVAIEEVSPERSGFILRGRGADRCEYRLEMDLELPTDPRTRTIMGELLVQSEWRIFRRAATPLKARARTRARKSVQ